MDQITSPVRKLQTPLGDLVTSHDEIDSTGQHRLIVEIETVKVPALSLEDSNRGKNWEH